MQNTYTRERRAPRSNSRGGHSSTAAPRTASAPSKGRSSRSTTSHVSSGHTGRFVSAPSRFSRPSTGGSRFGSRPSFNRGGNRGRSGGRGFRGDYIDENKYINKAIPKAESAYTPTHTFSDFEVSEQLAKNIASKQFIYPSPIQDQAIPVALTGRDVIGIASTGTGKTAAFLIPLINKLVLDRKHKVMVLAPTRELAAQIEVEFRALAFNLKLFSVACVGGSPIMRQIRELELGVHMVIGTPGRIKDLIERRKINMAEYGSIVLDEADRMLDMGFIGDMRYILGLMPSTRQTLFFSATLSSEIKKLCSDFLNNPVTVAIASRDTASSVEQNIVRVADKTKKLETLEEILRRPEVSKVLIFRETKRNVDALARDLRAGGFKALALHGDMRNRERDRAVKALASGDAHIVIATDVAARGIDIPDITHVINYDVPQTYDTYVHRIGRTGRANKVGHALTFV